MTDKAKENKSQEQQKIEEVKELKEEKPVKVYKIIKNIKYGEDIFKIGDKVEIPDEDLQEFIDAKAIKAEE